MRQHAGYVMRERPWPAVTQSGVTEDTRDIAADAAEGGSGGGGGDGGDGGRDGESRAVRRRGDTHHHSRRGLLHTGRSAAAEGGGR
jgi:hypothetical protein